MSNLSPTLAVRDMKETIDFYTKSLGFKLGMCFPDAGNPEYADLSKDGMVIMILPAANLGISSEEKLGVGVNFYMQLDEDVDEYYDELKEKGVKITVDIQDEPFGIRDFTIEDNNGYRLTFNQISGTARTCLSCGMPMNKREDFGAGNPASLYCVNCTNPDGSLKSYEEVLEGTIGYMMISQNLDRGVAEIEAKEHLAKMPAWSGN